MHKVDSPDRRPQMRPGNSRTELVDQSSWWVTPAAYDAGYYDKLYDALRAWVANKMPFERPYYSNRQVPPRFG